MSSLFSKRKRSVGLLAPRVGGGGCEDESIHSRSNHEEHRGDSPAGLPFATTFAELGLAPPLVQTCRELGFTRPTPVQCCIIPFLLQQQQQQQQQHKGLNDDDCYHTNTHSSSSILVTAATGSGKTAAFVLPILHYLISDPYGIAAVIVTPTRELAQQIHQQVLALGSHYHIQSCLVTGGNNNNNSTSNNNNTAIHSQASRLQQTRPHFCVATPGRLAALLRGPTPRPVLAQARYLVLDEADRLLQSASGFERDVAELLLHCNNNNNNRKIQRQTLLFSATMTRSLASLEEIAGLGVLRKFVIPQAYNKQQQQGEGKEEQIVVAVDDEVETSLGAAPDTEHAVVASNKKQKCTATSTDSSRKALVATTATTTTCTIPAGLKQEYIFMPSRVRDAYLLTCIRELMANGGRKTGTINKTVPLSTKQQQKHGRNKGPTTTAPPDDNDGANSANKARSAIIFVSTCERAAHVSGLLSHLGVPNVALHSLLSQNRRSASLGQFKSQIVSVLVATDLAARGLDIPSVDLVVNAELPRSGVTYVHRVGRTARAGRRGRAVSLVGEAEVALVHAAEQASGRALEKCGDVSDEMALELLGPVQKAARLTKMKLSEIGFDEVVAKFKERKVRDKKERERIERALAKK
jgi:ATP-dependent RNA helicase DDX49/DBP8